MFESKVKPIINQYHITNALNTEAIENAQYMYNTKVNRFAFFHFFGFELYLLSTRYSCMPC